MAPRKVNPLLASLEAKLEAEYRGRLRSNTELDLITTLVAANDVLEVGPGRSGKFIDAFIHIKNQIAQDIVDDSESDEQLLHSKKDIAMRIKAILGPENWRKYQELFPLLGDYWDD